MNFIESRPFTSVLPRYFADDGAYALLQSDLSENPEAGTIMPGTGHFRKFRWNDTQRGKGKRSGLRVIYVYIPDIQTIFLAEVYDKDKKDDLSPEEKRGLKMGGERLVTELRWMHERRTNLQR